MIKAKAIPITDSVLAPVTQLGKLNGTQISATTFQIPSPANPENVTSKT